MITSCCNFSENVVLYVGIENCSRRTLNTISGCSAVWDEALNESTRCVVRSESPQELCSQRGSALGVTKLLGNR